MADIQREGRHSNDERRKRAGSLPPVKPKSKGEGKPREVPYHGAEPVHVGVRAVIRATPRGARLPMSANRMMEILVSNGVHKGMAAKLPSQIRKGAILHEEWKAAFASGRFVQKLGRSSNEEIFHPPSVPVLVERAGEVGKMKAPSNARDELLGGKKVDVPMPPLEVHGHSCAWVAGENKSGQHGLGSIGSTDLALEMSFQEFPALPGGHTIGQVSCGDAHTIILSTEGTLFGCGLSDSGQLGLGRIGEFQLTKFKPLSTLPGGKIAKKVVCGGFHTMVLTKDGQLFACGNNNHGQLGLGHTKECFEFTAVPEVGLSRLVDVFCGSYHTMSLDDKGRLFSCGLNWCVVVNAFSVNTIQFWVFDLPFFYSFLNSTYLAGMVNLGSALTMTAICLLQFRSLRIPA